MRKKRHLIFLHSNKIHQIFTVFVLIFFITTQLTGAKEKRLQVRGDENYPPYEYLNDANQPEGFNVDIIRAIADAMNLDIQIEMGPWHEIRGQLEKGEIDILTGMYETEERRKLVEFAVPHIMPSYGIFVPENSKINSLEDVSQKTILVQKEDLGHDFVRENQLSEKIIAEISPEKVLTALAGGYGDCAILPRLQGAMIIREFNFDKIKIVGPPFLQRNYCMAVQMGNDRLRAQLNEGLNIIKESGEYDKIYHKWFGIYSEEQWNFKKIIRSVALIITPLIVIIIVIFFWNWMLKKQVALRTEELRKNRENLRITLNSIGDAVISTDIHGKIVRMNPIAEKLTGWKLSEVEGEYLEDIVSLIHADTREKVENPMRKVIKERKIVGLAADTILVSRSGREYRISDSAAPIMDSQKKIVGVVLVFRDVTKEYSTLEQLQQSEQNLRTVFEAAQSVAFIKTEVQGQRSKIILFSPGAEQIFGYKDKEVLGMPVSILHVSENLKKLDQTLIPENKNRTGFNREIRMVKKTGQEFYAFFSTHHLYNQSGKMVSVICVAVDISKQKQVERQMQKMQNIQRIGTLAGGIAHDFNNILTGIYGNISIAQLHLTENHPAREVLRDAEKSMSRATRLTRQLLTFSKGGAPIKEILNFSKIAEDIINFDLSGSNVKLILSSQTDLWPVEADKSQIEQVFSNLTINASQSMPDGGKIFVSLENRAVKKEEIPGLKEGNYVKIKFTDEGAGIEPEHIDRIFDPYFTTKETGSGLGLSTVYSIISKHSGQISVSSKFGRGTTFTIYIPAFYKPAATTTNSARQEKSGKMKSLTILLMDDEEMICKLAGSMLKELGHIVTITHDGKETIAKYREAQDEGRGYDLVILDLTIPGGMGGRETCARLLELDSETKIIVSSGYTRDKIMSSFAEYGFQGLIEKPYTIGKMKEVIDQIFSENNL